MTTTMSETFDATMVDSGDIDVSMYPTITTADTWLSVEATMGEDGVIAHPAFNYAQEDVEVEMGDDDDEPITEYEMALEGDGYDGQELLDVEVYDVSQAPSPLAIEDNGVNSHDLLQDTELQPFLPDDHPQELPDVPIMESSVVSDAVELVLAPQSADLVQPQVDNVPEGFAEAPTTALEGVEEVVSDPLGSGVTGDVDSENYSSIPVDELAVPSDNLPVAPAVVSPVPAASDSLVQDFPSPHEEQEQHVATSTTTGEDHADVHDIVDPSADQIREKGDPHEISEGVYIDPPPAVLLSLPSSAPHSECSLFNLPTSSVPHSPSSSAKPDSGDGLHLLLHARPTLYYEPLSAVFAALREEQYIQNMPGISDAELVLDAYDLQLAVSEDNVYTHEVTLHELNVIHDGSDLNGPLRLRLKVIAPRFVTRYNTLRDQIARLNFSADEDGTYADGVTSNEQFVAADLPTGSTYDHQDEEEVTAHNTSEHPEDDTNENESEPVDHSAPPNTADYYQNDPAALLETVQVQTEVEAGTELAAGPESTAGVGPEENVDFEEGVTESHVDEPTNDESAVAQVEQEQFATDEASEPGEEVEEYEESEETFDDADEDHRPATEEGDYVDHADFPDDEDDFGDDPLEEFGGEVYEAHPHPEVAAEHPNEVPLVEEVFDERPPDGSSHDEAAADLQLNTDVGEYTNSATEVDQEDHVHSATTPLSAINPEVGETTQHDTDNQLEAYEEWDDWDANYDPDLEAEKAAPSEVVDTLSRKSSTTTLASRTSKRAREEDELQDFDDDDDFAPASPDNKRARVE